MDNKKLKALKTYYIVMSVFTGIFFLAVLGGLIYAVIKPNNFAVYISLVELPILAFLTSFFISQAVRIKKTDSDKKDIEKDDQDKNNSDKNDVEKNNQEKGEKVD